MNQHTALTIAHNVPDMWDTSEKFINGISGKNNTTISAANKNSTEKILIIANRFSIVNGFFIVNDINGFRYIKPINVGFIYTVLLNHTVLKTCVKHASCSFSCSWVAIKAGFDNDATTFSSFDSQYIIDINVHTVTCDIKESVRLRFTGVCDANHKNSYEEKSSPSAFILDL